MARRKTIGLPFSDQLGYLLGTFTFLLKPTAPKSSPQQSGDHSGTTAHDVPEETRPIILDHHNDRPLIDSEVIRCDPPTSRTIRDNKRLIERRLEAIFSSHSQIHLCKMFHGWNDDFRSKRQRGHYNPGSDSAVVRTEWGTSSYCLLYTSP